MKLKLTINIQGETKEDLVLALEEVCKWVNEDYTSGFNRNETGRYNFKVEEE